MSTDRTSTDDLEPRRSPLVPSLILWIVFAALVAASVFTVLIPELGGNADEDESSESAESTPEP